MNDYLDISIEDISVVLEKHEIGDFSFVNPSRYWDGFVLFTDGVGIYTDSNGDRYDFTSGSLLLLKEGQQYEIHSLGSCSYITSAITVSDNSSIFNINIPSFINCTEQQIRLIKDICNTWQTHTRFSYMSCKVMLLELYLDIYSSLLNITENDDSDIGKIKNYIHRHYGNDYDFEAITKLVSLSPSYIRSKFKSCTGTTICSYREALRINAAREMLQSGHFSQKETAMSLGYCDTFHFSKAFKKATGTTPCKLKNKLK